MRPFDDVTERDLRAIHCNSRGEDIYPGQDAEASLRCIPGGTTFLPPVPVYRISPFGVEIDVSQLLPDSTGPEFNEGSLLDLNLSVAGRCYEYRQLPIAQVRTVADKQLLGLRWPVSRRVVGGWRDERQVRRWECSGQIYPIGTAVNPARFDDVIHFRVLDMSANGMRLATSMRNRVIVRGMAFKADIVFPGGTFVTVPITISNIGTSTQSGQDELVLGVVMTDELESARSAIGQYLMLFGPPTNPRELKQNGLPVRSVNRAVEFGFVRTSADYAQVLSLRKLAYSGAGKTQENIADADMGDDFDRRARIIVARYRNRVVGSARLMFHPPDELNEYDRFVDFPDDFPSREHIAVASRVCTHPDFRGSDLVYGLLKQLVLVATHGRRRYILGGSSEVLLPLYVKLGYQGTGLYFEHGDLNKVKEQVILGDVVSMLSGSSVPNDAWDLLYKDLDTHIRQYHGLGYHHLTGAREN